MFVIESNSISQMFWERNILCNLENTSSQHELSNHRKRKDSIVTLSGDEVVFNSAEIVPITRAMNELVTVSRLDQSMQILDKSLTDRPQNNDTWDGFEECQALSGFYQYPEDCVNMGYMLDETHAQSNGSFEQDVLYPVEESDHSSGCQIISCSPSLNLRDSRKVGLRGSKGTIPKDRSGARGSKSVELDSHSVICIDCSDEGDNAFGKSHGDQGTAGEPLEEKSTCYQEECRPEITLDYPMHLSFEEVFSGFNNVQSCSLPRAESTPNRKRRRKIEGCLENPKDLDCLNIRYLDACTPEPSYDRMKTPELKRELSKIGLKTHYGKKRMIKTLKEVYKQTHQFETVLDENEDSGEDAVANEGIQCEQAKLYESVQDLGSENALEESKLHVLQMKELIMSNEEMYKRVLLYRPIPLSQIMAVVRQNGMKLDQKHVMLALDFLSVTFTLEQSRRRHLKGRCRRHLPTKQPSTQ